MQLFKAHAQWKSRPSDERFQSVTSLHNACVKYMNAAKEAEVAGDSLRVEAVDQELKLVGRTGSQATLGNWAMGQLSARAGAPANYLRKLPATLAAQNINHGLKTRQAHMGPDDKAQLLFHADEETGLVMRAITSDSYSRIWNAEITERLVRLQESNPNWKNPMAYKVLAPGTNGSWPEMSQEMEPAGLYASDHDMFAFLVDESKSLKGSPEGIKRGFFVWNSEVGAAAFGVTTFLYDMVCGNNIVWGASDVNEIRIRHTGRAPEKAFGELTGELIKYSESSASDTEAMIERAQKFSLGKTKAEALDSIFGIATKAKVTDVLSRSRLQEGLEVAEKREERYGNPYSLWGAVSGVTEDRSGRWKAA
jgi:hypothetical protein